MSEPTKATWNVPPPFGGLVKAESRKLLARRVYGTREAMAVIRKELLVIDQEFLRIQGPDGAMILEALVRIAAAARVAAGQEELAYVQGM